MAVKKLVREDGNEILVDRALKDAEGGDIASKTWVQENVPQGPKGEKGDPGSIEGAGFPLTLQNSTGVVKAEFDRGFKSSTELIQTPYLDLQDANDKARYMSYGIIPFSSSASSATGKLLSFPIGEEGTFATREWVQENGGGSAGGDFTYVLEGNPTSSSGETYTWVLPEEEYAKAKSAAALQISLLGDIRFVNHGAGLYLGPATVFTSEGATDFAAYTGEIVFDDEARTLAGKLSVTPLVMRDQLKTINGQSLIGTGDITIEGGSVDAYTKAEADGRYLAKETEGSDGLEAVAQKFVVRGGKKASDNGGSFQVVGLEDSSEPVSIAITKLTSSALSLVSISMPETSNGFLCNLLFPATGSFTVPETIATREWVNEKGTEGPEFELTYTFQFDSGAIGGVVGDFIINEELSSFLQNAKGKVILNMDIVLNGHTRNSRFILTPTFAYNNSTPVVWNYSWNCEAMTGFLDLSASGGGSVNTWKVSLSSSHGNSTCSLQISIHPENKPAGTGS